MRKTILSAVSVIAIMGAAPAFAANAEVDSNTAAKIQQDNAVVTEKEMKEGWEDTKDAVSETADDVSAAAKDMYEDVRSAFVTDENAADATTRINMRRVATNVIGASVYNTDGEAIAKVHDVILDSNGQTSMIILADGEIFGMGKQVAFDHAVIAGETAEGDLIAPLTEKVIAEAAPFSYEPDVDDEKVRVIPANGYSVNKLMDAQIVNPEGRVLADVDNIVFTQGQASNMIVSFNKTLGMGGNSALMSLNDAELMKNSENGNYTFELNAEKSAQFESYKKQF